MISPAIWHRAVVLTKKRIESSVPLTLNEIQADKDQLRAEFAMSTRKLEMSLQELRETTANQVIEINKKRDELALLSAESKEKIQSVEELDAQSERLRNDLGDKENSLEKTSMSLRDTETKLEETALELEKLRSEYSKIQNDADSSRIELVAKQASIEEHSATEEQLAKQIIDLKRELKSYRNADADASDRDARLTRLQNTNVDLEQKIKERDTLISNFRKTNSSNDENSSELMSQLTDEKSKSAELESKLAASVLRMEALLEDASNTNVKKAMESLNQDRDSLKKSLKEVTSERDKIKTELAAQKLSNETSWDEERRENATLRERINDLAAQVTAMTAALEGPDSPINEILGKDKVKALKSDKKKNDQQVETLADRIRALQESARIKQA